MKATRFGPALALSLVVAMAAAPAEAQRRGGGGGGGGYRGGGGGGGYRGGGGGGGWHGGGGGGYRGGGYGYAVPRGSYGGGWRGGVAGARHPQGGTGYYGRSYGGGYYGGHKGYYGGYRGYYGGHYGGYYRPYYYPYYRPYYYGGYWPYYGSSFALSFGWGWPYYSSAAPYAGVSYVYAPSESSGYSAPAPGYGSQVYRDDGRPAPEPREEAPVVSTRDTGSLRLEVRPEDTSIYVDDNFAGTAREARILRLGPGRHAIELVRPGYATERHMVEIVTGERSDLLVEMQRPR